MVYWFYFLLAAQRLRVLRIQIMEAIFSLPYSEYRAIERLVEFLPKSEGYGVYVPVSRQQARCDFVVLTTKPNASCASEELAPFPMVEIANATILVPELRGVLPCELCEYFLAFWSVPGVRSGAKGER